MTDCEIVDKTIELYDKCNIHSFPFRCVELLKQLEYTVMSYSEIGKANPHLYKICFAYSEDAFLDKNNRFIAYNSNLTKERIRFTLMHELGHDILGHKGNKQRNEKEANCFASNMLAPRIAIHYSGCKNAEDVSYYFKISHMASKIAYNEYRQWYRFITYNKINLRNNKMYIHFYNSQLDEFIWHMDKCRKCGDIIYNHPDMELCEGCNEHDLDIIPDIVL
ncbi:ImmA/IrrE family metallo-endopeptidase [Lachnospiraceae bacterium ASD3451]|uniref:ImmA/IrrE family metallo-endopeptidase n=1 Tax=Diplocloster agilis TaxID=2850323 RepID=UPI001D8DC0A5|nr:ImmA/IrrE family metallo-endopeptidase [Diplocloster agilis]MBU9745730.1 ImmA/IrrE family metallo-endopeptidase [Diplocloster agilis]